MPDTPSRRPSNRILARLSRAEFASLDPHLEAVELPVKRVLETRKRRIDQVYFVESGFASVVADGSTKPSIEVGIIGREGMTGLGVILGNDRAAHNTYMQAAGSALKISAQDLRKADQESAALHRAILRYAQEFLLQTTSTVLANGRSKIEERLARWLLMARDRLTSDDLPLTHEFLGLMLGTYRPGVTKAVQMLEKEGLIGARRGGIRILDRKELEKRSNGTYVALDG
jgi:CRP-like cAMP-binding protein